MAELINLRMVKKQKSRAERERHADANRVKFGKTKAEKNQSKLARQREKSLLDGHKLASTGHSDQDDV